MRTQFPTDFTGAQDFRYYGFIRDSVLDLSTVNLLGQPGVLFQTNHPLVSAFPPRSFRGRILARMTGTTRRAGICTEKHRLTEAVVYAVRQIQGLHDSEIADLLAGRTGEDHGRFDIAIKLARQRWVEAKGAYMKHVKEHCC